MCWWAPFSSENFNLGVKKSDVGRYWWTSDSDTIMRKLFGLWPFENVSKNINASSLKTVTAFLFQWTFFFNGHSLLAFHVRVSVPQIEKFTKKLMLTKKICLQFFFRVHNVYEIFPIWYQSQYIQFGILILAYMVKTQYLVESYTLFSGTTLFIWKLNPCYLVS